MFSYLILSLLCFAIILDIVAQHVDTVEVQDIIEDWLSFGTAARIVTSMLIMLLSPVLVIAAIVVSLIGK